MTETSPNPPSPERLTTSEVCLRLRISRATLWRRIRSSALPGPVDRGRQALFAASDIDAVMARGTHPASSGDVIDAAIEGRLLALAQRRRPRPLKS